MNAIKEGYAHFVKLLVSPGAEEKAAEEVILMMQYFWLVDC